MIRGYLKSYSRVNKQLYTNHSLDPETWDRLSYFWHHLEFYAIVDRR
jgi:hypothetical protein